jgi:hypothetical protein
VLVHNSVLEQEFTTTDVTPGQTYSFKVTSRNTVGSSLQSESVLILAAKIPDAPIDLNNVPGITTGYIIGLDWNNGVYDGASQVIDFEIHYADDQGQYSLYRSGIIDSNIIVIGLTPGMTYTFYAKARNIIGQSD